MTHWLPEGPGFDLCANFACSPSVCAVYCHGAEHTILLTGESTVYCGQVLM